MLLYMLNQIRTVMRTQMTHLTLKPPREQNKLGPRVGQQAQYPLSDEIIDNSVMIGVEFVLLLLESF